MKELKPAGTYLSVLTILLGVCGLAGWLLDLPVLYGFLSKSASMKFNTALVTLLLGVATLCYQLGYKQSSRILGSIVLLFSLSILSGYVFSIDLNIDQWVVGDQFTNTQQAPPGRMSAFTATCFLLVSFGMELFASKKPSAAQSILTLCFLLVYSASIGLLLNISGLFQFGQYSAIAFPTTLGLLSATLGLLYTSKYQGWLSEAFSRHSASVPVRFAVLYFLILLPIIIAGFIWILKHTTVTPEYAMVVLMLGAAVLTLPWAFLILRKLNRSDDRLHSLIEELQKSRKKLNEKNQELTFVNQELDSLLHIVSHDLRTPLMSLEGSLELLHRRLENKVEDKDRQLFTIPGKSIKRLRNTIEHLGQIIKSQKLNAEGAEEVDLCALVDDIRAELSETLQSTGGRITTQVDDCQIFYKRVHLRSILQNLITNAIKFRHPDRAPIVHIQASPTKDGVQIAITDNGLGIPQKDLPDLFHKYRRFHQHVEGTGVGLYLVQQLIGIKGGTIEVKSQEGAGTTFTLFLPV
ncbi:hypothetical protein HH214_12730 [Mucilaginibacter robiniae]|uniref:histidine kinase n=1 Tax=Mucilaginibacter robiniae TaxID=2728022 RepID=A0A7L5E2W2_9SPHI|nr:ATP-binding protein [Mucilaginibacter robiniae]QJD96679.1 hypothetical protein HH214_12730 [Mucilaginibacter robiniae]